MRDIQVIFVWRQPLICLYESKEIPLVGIALSDNISAASCLSLNSQSFTKKHTTLLEKSVSEWHSPLFRYMRSEYPG